MTIESFTVNSDVLKSMVEHYCCKYIQCFECGLQEQCKNLRHFLIENPNIELNIEKVKK